MSIIPDEVIEQVRDAADMVEIIGEHVTLKRTGTDYRGPCPFHGGAHRNFAVIPKKQMYYCFVCHEGGDVFTFFMKRLGMEYPTAVREVARRCGISIPERSTGGPDPREPLFSAVSVAADWYAKRLREADDARTARDYLTKRGFDTERSALLGLGYSPKGNEFLDAMSVLGIAVDVLLEAGLAVKRDDGTVRPRFWNRLLFPIHDLRGRIVAFGGRVLGDGEPKYLNSPDSQVFHKRQLLYNLHAAKHAIRKAERALVVEGYFDVLGLADAGVEEVVAPLGTSLTADQARLLKRYTQTVILVYDSDVPGLRATFRAADELLRAGLRVIVATLPQGEDPDSLARTGGEKVVRALLDDGLDVLERKIQILDLKGWLGTLSGRRRALDRLLPTIRAAADPVTLDLYIDRTAEALGVAPESVKRESEISRRMAPDRRSPAGSDSPDRSPRDQEFKRVTPERELVRVMLHAPQWRMRILELLPADAEITEPERAVLGLLTNADPDVSGGEILQLVEGEARTLVETLLARGLGEVKVDAIVDGALARLDQRPITARKRALARRITVASESEKLELLREKVALSHEARKLKTPEWNVLRRGGKGSAG